ncbi:MAG: sulfatase-like hydrolase/transferase [Verrucomicrobiales bacterium]|nr:sulfatase-like hydrolase/transferase [Verrucomicrobiales bacterium]
MKKLEFFLIFVGFTFCFLAKSLTAASDHPDILFIFADDQAFSTIHALGNQEIKTPNLDRLVKRGTTFTHAYNMGSWSGAVCVASRHMLNTGLYVWKAKKAADALRQRISKKSKQDTTTNFKEQGLMWSQLMGKAGYDTYFTGKWHVNTNAAQIFKVARHIRAGMPKQTPEGYNRPQDGKPDVWSPYDKKFGGYWEGGKHWSEVVADDVEDYFTMVKEQGNPFFMYVAFNAAHDPRQAPKEYVDQYPLDKLSLPENFLPEYPWNEKMNSGRKLRDERLAPFPRTEHAVKVNMQEYYALITHMDAQIGKILKALDDSGRADNTWIFFTADHGLAIGQHGLMGKQNMFEHSLRVPFIVAGPGVKKDHRIDTRIYLQDVMPTTLHLAKAEIPKHVQFQSLLPLLEGNDKNAREAIYGAYLTHQRAVIEGDHKLILYPKAAKALLFNVKTDPHEMKDVLSRNQQLGKKLFQRLLELQQQTGDELDLKTIFPDLL